MSDDDATTEEMAKRLGVSLDELGAIEEELPPPRSRRRPLCWDRSSVKEWIRSLRSASPLS
jgi:hypothetical protein